MDETVGHRCRSGQYKSVRFFFKADNQNDQNDWAKILLHLKKKKKYVKIVLKENNVGFFFIASSGLVVLMAVTFHVSYLSDSLEFNLKHGIGYTAQSVS